MNPDELVAALADFLCSSSVVRPTASEMAAIDPVVEDAASESDRVWFAAHPRARARIRFALPSEGCRGADGRIVVLQVQPGARFRLPIEKAADAARMLRPWLGEKLAHQLTRIGRELK